MPLLLALTLALQAQTPAADVPPENEIVVTARRAGGCTYSVDRKAMDLQQLEQRARTWSADRAVKVVADASVSRECLKRVALKLGAQGVVLMRFVTPDDTSIMLWEPGVDRSLPGSRPSVAPDLRTQELSFTRRRTAQLIREGKCQEALDLALELEALDAASEVVSVCNSPLYRGRE